MMTRLCHDQQGLLIKTNNIFRTNDFKIIFNRLGSNIFNCLILGDSPTRLFYQIERNKEISRLEEKLDDFLQQNSEACLVAYGEAGTGKTYLVKLVIESKFSDKMELKVVYWVNATKFDANNFYNKFADDIGLGEQSLSPAERFRKAQSLVQGGLLVIFDDVYQDSFYEIVPIFEKFGNATRALCIARELRDESTFPNSYHFGTLERLEIEQILEHDLQAKALPKQSIEEIAELLSSVTGDLVLWVRIASSQLREMVNKSEMMLHLAKAEMPGSAKGNLDVLLGFNQVEAFLRQTCYAILAFGKAANVELEDVAILLKCPLKTAWHLVENLSNRSLVRFTPKNRDNYHGQVNIHAILFDKMLCYATDKEEDPEWPVICGLSERKSVSGKLDCLIANFFCDNHQDILHKVIDQRRGLLLRMAVDALLTTGRKAQLLDLLEHEIKGKSALLKLFEASNWTKRPVPRANFGLSENFGMEILGEVCNALLADESSKDKFKNFLMESEIYKRLCDSCKQNECDQSNNMAFIASAFDYHYLLELLLSNEEVKQQINNVDENGNSCILLATRNGRPYSCGCLMKHGADPNLRNKDGETALVTAAFDDDIFRLTFLLPPHGNPDVGKENGRGVSPIAATLLPYKPNKEGAKMLFKYDPNLDVSAGCNKYLLSCSDLAGELGHPDMVTFIKEQKPEADHSSQVENVRLVALLLHIRCYLALEWPDDQNGLLQAVIDNDSEMFKQLIQGIEDNELQERLIRIAFLAAACYNYPAIIKECFKLDKTVVNATTNMFHDSALHLAAIRDHDEIVTILLNHLGMSPNTSNIHGMTPLLYCCVHRSEKVAQLLLADRRIDPNAFEGAGHNAFHYACFLKLDAILTTLLKHPKLNMNATSFEGRTPLMAAVQSGSLDMVKKLVESGRKIAIADKFDRDEKSAIDRANMLAEKFPEKAENYRNIAKYLANQSP